MHPDITKTTAALRVDEKHAAAAAARLARQARRPPQPGRDLPRRRTAAMPWRTRRPAGERCS